MSRKAGLHAENYTVKENVERDTADAETGLNNQQQSSDGLKIEGLALPFGKRSRNGVVYEKESVKEAAESLIGCSLLFNHDEDNPIGHIEDVEITDEGLKYYGDLNEERKEVESLKRGDIPHVSIQAMVKETSGTETKGEVGITEFLEMSAVTVPGFSQTDVEASEETVMIEKLMTEKEAEEKLDNQTETEQVEDGFEFVPIPSLVLYDNEGDARERANDLGIKGIHTHEIDGNTFYMAGKTHGEWRQLVGKEQSEKLFNESTSKEPFADYSDFEECVADNQDKSDPEAYCAAIKRKAEIKERILGENQNMTEQLTEQLENVSSSEFYELVAQVHENLSKEDVQSLFEEFTFEGDVMEVLESIAEEEDDMDDEEDDEQEEGDMPDDDTDTDDDKSGDEEDESTESESSNKNGASQDGNNDMDKTKEELENRIEELEETVMQLEDTEPSKQEGANKPESSDGFSVRKDIKDRLDR